MTKAFGARFVGVAGIVDFVDDVAGVCLSPNPIAPSRLGLSFSIFKKNNCELGEMRVIGRRDRSSDTTWTNRLYRRETVRDHFNELEVLLEEVTEPHRRLGLVFRAYNEGAAFRYFIPEQEDVPGFELMRELTEWRFPEQRLDRLCCGNPHDAGREPVARRDLRGHAARPPLQQRYNPQPQPAAGGRR